ncbi:hypothetical protein PYW08_015267 [Mythimna loreyi]|uniref:Uncharacterized protein n=1 Tax=Mythimna loreyi TaxID=667449 RepID=A0ACC2QX43_9NEOP|nr:hypothetical protein PYW08_015267 [Mythimna loreyi]
MGNDNEDSHDPKGQGQPPPYTSNNAPQIITPQVMRPTAMMPIQTMQPMFAPIGQPVHATMGHSIHIQQGTMMSTGGLFQTQPVVVPVVVGNQMGPQPSSITCPSCREVIVTRVEAKSTTKTHLIATMLCFMCCWPCVFIPYCTDSCRNADHYCPNCNSYIGSYVH